ncbi:transmembrane protein C1orf162 homolog [Rana temporaria]|uniref:transmembrane protein C1orf162 homolog n=1 Tax=Rana temporaria TaxID=8407 RepID=UPI001AAD6FC4|nr:transmembrane protein C1orf162 homolog [Rana temporaria]
MGGGSSKSTQSSTTTTTVAYTTTQSTAIKPGSTEHLLENCSVDAIILAFFSGAMVTLLIFALIFCAIKVKQKVKHDPTVSPDRSKEVSSPTGLHMHQALDEGITYATLSFDERKSMVHGNNQARPTSSFI